jgi:hypothetical protein
MDIFSQIAEKIIREQESIIGPIALEQAQKVPGLSVDPQKNQITIQGNKTETLERLVERYKGLFGQASVQACKEAAKGLLSKVPQDQVPALLK